MKPRGEYRRESHRKRWSSGHAWRQGGFTLVELTIVLVIMAIVAAVVIPAMKGTYEDELLRSTGRDLTGAMNLAYSQAVTEHTLHRLYLDEKGERYRVEKKGSADEGGFVPMKHLTGSEGKIDKRIKIEVREVSPEMEGQEIPAEPVTGGERTREAVEFYPDGRAESKEIVLRDRTGYQLALRVNPITGRVVVIDVGRRR